MGCVGDELTLLLPCPVHRLCHPVSQEKADAEKDQKTGQADEDTVPYQAAQYGQFI